MSFQRAERKKAKLRLALAGPSGSGKTYSAILIAKGIGSKIAMIDTEHHSGELYSDLTEYYVESLEAPYSPERYIKLINTAEKEGYDVLIIDSLSHAWCGEGGVLDMVDQAAKSMRNQNSFTAWRHVTPQHNRLVDTILSSKLHIIVTMRTKTDHDTTVDEKGKMKVEKVGLAPIQREGLDYEFTTVLDLSVDGHIAKSSKDRTGIFDGKFVLLTEQVGKQILDWLNRGQEEIAMMPDQSMSIEDQFKLSLLRIYDADTEDKLRIVFMQAIKEWSNDEEMKAKIIDAKDKRKQELYELEVKKVESHYAHMQEKAA